MSKTLYHCKKLFISLCKGLIILLLIVALLIGFNALYPGLLDHTDFIISQYHWVCTLLRWAFLLSLFFTWPMIFRHIAKTRRWTDNQLNEWLARRIKIIMWFILFELIVCENIFLTLFNMWKR